VRPIGDDPLTMGAEDPNARTMRSFGLDDEDIAAWRAAELPQEAFVDWLTDRVARRPSGSRARRVYGADDVHDFARRAVLACLELTASDHLLEIGCGGGLLLRDALRAGAQVTGLDHSDEMVRLARERAPGAEVLLADADALPFGADAFTAVAMSVVFFFFDRPLAVLGECRRVLRPGGRLVVYTTSPELRGTPAAPEPLASRGHFYTDEQLAALVRESGLHDVSVTREEGAQLLSGRA
jgi:SAM-dependent methyltransferase